MATIKSFTALYASPQQKRGHTPNRRDDVYSLAVLWYQLLRCDLSLERPSGDGWKRVLAKLGVSDSAVSLLNRCWDDEAEERPADGNELVAELRGRHLPRKLPIYWVISCSRRMGDEVLEAVTQGFRSILDDLQSNPQALETVWMSVIVVGSDAWVKNPLVEVGEFQVPHLYMEGKGELALGAAFTLLNDRISREVLPRTADSPGDYRPLVFVLLSSTPTDNWVEPAKALLSRQAPQIGSFATAMAGPSVKASDFQQVPGLNPIQLNEATPASWGAFFRWIDQ